MATTKDKFAFALELGRRTRASVRQCEALLRYAGTLARLDAYLTARNVDKRERIQRKVMELCGEFLMTEGSIWKLTAPDSQRIRCQCGQMALYGRSPNGGAPFWYECQACFPYGAVFSGAVLKIRVPDGGEVVVPS